MWDYLDGAILASIWVGLPITNLAASRISQGSSPSVFVATTKPQSSSSGTGKAIDAFNYHGRTNSIVQAVSLATQKGANSSVALPDSDSDADSQPSVPTKKPKTIARVGKMKECNGLVTSADGKWLVAIGNKKVHVVNLQTLSSEANSGFIKISSEEPLTTLAFHPHEPIFATGDAIGKIRIWNFLNDESFFRSLAQADASGVDRQAPSSVLHWHAHAVSSLAFSPNGASLASGGEEAVLVLWNLNQNNSKEFIPRLGAPIASISVAGATINPANGKESGEIEYVAALKDGSVTFVGSGNLRVSRTFARVKNGKSSCSLSFSLCLSFPQSVFFSIALRTYSSDASIKPSSSSALASLPLPLAIQPVTGHLVLPSGHPSTVQFFSVSSDSHVQDLEVAASNRVSRPEDTPLEPTRVEQVVFSTDAKWMATLESRQAGAGLSSDSALKFWRWNNKEGKYIMNSRVDKPHSKGKVLSMSFSPSPALSSMEDDLDNGKDPLFVTTGTDLNTKTWQTSISTLKGGRTEKYWSARSIFKYKTSLPVDAAWSTDKNGSLLAVTHGDVVTLWESSSNSMMKVLSCPEMERVKSVKFVGKGGRYLALLTLHHVVVWDLVMGDVTGTLRLEHKVNELVADEEEGNHLLISQVNQKKSKVQVFDPSRPSNAGVLVPVSKYSAPLSFKNVLSFGSSFVRPSSSSSASTSRSRVSSNVPSLLVSTPQRSIVLVGSMSSSLSASIGSTTQSLRNVDLSQKTFFDELFGLSNSEDTQVMEELEKRQREEREKSRTMFNFAGGDNRMKDVYKLFDAPSHLLPPVTSLSRSLFKAILSPAKTNNEGVSQVDQDIEDDEDEVEDDRMDVDQDEAEEKEIDGGAEDELRIQELQTQDMSYLTDLFRQTLTTSPSASLPSECTPIASCLRTGLILPFHLCDAPPASTPKPKAKTNGISTPASQDLASAKKKQKSANSSAVGTPTVKGSGKKPRKS